MIRKTILAGAFTLMLATPVLATYGPAGPQDFPNQRDEILSLQEQLKSARPGQHAVLKRRIKVKTDQLQRQIKRLQAKYDKKRKLALAPLERESRKKMRYLREQIKKAGQAVKDIQWHRQELWKMSRLLLFTRTRVRHDNSGIKGKQWHRDGLKDAQRRYTNPRNNMASAIGDLKVLDKKMRAIR